MPIAWISNLVHIQFHMDLFKDQDSKIILFKLYDLPTRRKRLLDIPAALVSTSQQSFCVPKIVEYIQKPLKAL